MHRPGRAQLLLCVILPLASVLSSCAPVLISQDSPQRPVESTSVATAEPSTADLPQVSSLAVASSSGENPMGPSTANARYVAANGSNASDGLSPTTGKEDVYSALVDMTNSTPGNSGGVVNLLQNRADTGAVRAQPLGLLGSRTTGGIWIMGAGDPNFVRIAGISRAGNVVTLVARSSVPGSPYYQVGRTISVFALSDASFDGNFVISSVSGSTITYAQDGTDASVTGGSGVVTPIGWIPQNNRGFDFRGQGGASGLAAGGAGAVTGMVAGQQYTPPNEIASATQTGSTVTVTVAVSTKTWVGLPVKIVGALPGRIQWHVHRLRGADQYHVHLRRSRFRPGPGDGRTGHDRTAQHLAERRL